jgi:ribosomal protein S18 acetylase RimI-like enzyme
MRGSIQHRAQRARRASGTCPVIVRQAAAGDAGAIAELRWALLCEENPAARQELGPRAREIALRLTRSQLVDRRQAFFVAIAGGRVVGVLRCAAARGSPLLQHDRYCAVTTAYVRPEFRRRGVLSQLLREVLHWCRRRDLDELRLQCKASNRSALTAWRALGFRETALVLQRRVE